METIKFRFKSISPAMMQNERLANPLDPIAKSIKAITSKRKKTDSDYEDIFRLEYEGNIYLDQEQGPFWPAQNIDRLFVDAGRKTRRGTDIKEVFMTVEEVNPLLYKGPRTIQGLYGNGEGSEFVDIRSVVIKGSRTMRCRPIFREWELEFSATYDDEVINRDDLIGIAVLGGSRVGLSTFRPRYGRYIVTQVDGNDYDYPDEPGELRRKV
jgi:hypothetical protein